MDWRVRVPGAIYRRAVERAGSDASLAVLVARWMTRYAEGETQHQQAAQARSASMTPERRREIAQAAAAARWGREPQ